MLEEKERQRQIKLAMEQKGDMMKNRERVLSACGIRAPQNLCTHLFIKINLQDNLKYRFQVKTIKGSSRSTTR